MGGYCEPWALPRGGMVKVVQSQFYAIGFQSYSKKCLFSMFQQREDDEVEMTIADCVRGMQQAKDVQRTNNLPDMTFPPQEENNSVNVGDYVWVKCNRRAKWNDPHCESLFQILLKTTTVMRIAERPSWIHLSHCKKHRRLPGESEGAVTACL